MPVTSVWPPVSKLHKAGQQGPVQCLSSAAAATMRSLLLASLLAVATARHAIVKELQYGFCAGAGQPLSIDEVVVEPYPIEVHTGATIHLAIGITLNEAIPAGSRVSLKIVKDLLIDLPLPCIPIGDIHLGSW